MSDQMEQKKVINRWVIVVGAILIQLCLGAIYAWSVFTKKVTDSGVNGAIARYQSCVALNASVPDDLKAPDFKFTNWIQSVDVKAEQAHVVLVLADAKTQAKKLKDALEAYKRYLALEPDEQAVARQVEYKNDGATSLKDAVSEKIKEIETNLAAPRVERIKVASILGYTPSARVPEMDEQIKTAEQAVQTAPTDSKAAYQLGLLLQKRGGEYGFSASQASWIFSAGLASFAAVMLFAGRWQAKSGPRMVALTGGVVLGIGYILGGLWGSTFLSQLICIGIIGGAGIGLAYVVPIAVGVKWFPDKKGMITGLSVAGFGFGATIWVKLAGSWGGGLLNTTSILGLPGVQSVFLIYGCVFLLLVVLASIVMVNPPAGWKPAGWNPQTSTGGGGSPVGSVNLTAGQMVTKPQYWGLFLMFIGSALAGLMVIYCIRLFGVDSLVANDVVSDAASAGKIAGTAMAWYAILNGLGRIVWGTASDKLGRKNALFAMCLLQGIMMLLFFRVGTTEMGLIVGACIIGFNFGGNFALFPAATADFFGNKNVGSNYPWVFLAYGVAGITGPQIAGYFKDHATNVEAWKTPFLIAGIACLAAAALGLLLKAPKTQENQ